MKAALLVLDMIRDYTTGRKMGSPAARAIRPALARLLSCARKAKVPVIYCQESHIPEDSELKVWGKHGMFGTPGAETDSLVKRKPGEPLVPKHTFGAFYGTHLEELLKSLQVDTLILTGVSTDLSVMHTAGEAFARGYKLVVAQDATAAKKSEDHECGLKFMARIYGADLSDTRALEAKLSNGGVSNA